MINQTAKARCSTGRESKTVWAVKTLGGPPGVHAWAAWQALCRWPGKDVARPKGGRQHECRHGKGAQDAFTSIVTARVIAWCNQSASAGAAGGCLLY